MSVSVSYTHLDVYKRQDGKSTKKDKSKVFAGDLNLIDDPVTKKRKEAQQKALKLSLIHI